MALKHKAIDPERGENALEVMYVEIRRAEKAIAEAEGLDRRMEPVKASVGNRFPAASRPVAVPADAPGWRES